MSAQYLVRFDDICPTMNWTIWVRIEPVLAVHKIKPILAVVPDNLDPKLMVQPARADFWDCVRTWQAQGWSIALHGYQHLYETRHAGLMGFNSYSEFAGLPYDVQRDKLVKALAVFSEQGVRPDAWIAPAHAFDAITVKALLDLGISVISDGFYCRPVKWLDALWIPQQMWRFKPMRFGLWTVCYHHNNFSEYSIRMLELDIERFASSVVSMDQVIRDGRVKERNCFDAAFSKLWLARLRAKEFMKRRLQRFRMS